MGPREYLQEELRNIGVTLQETLRHDYTPGSGLEYYEECRGRIKRLTDQVNVVNPLDSRAINQIAVSLSSVVSLPICLIERSHLGEFSWPFANELKAITGPLCTEPGPKGELKPIIHIHADGGLTAYRIYPETFRPNGIRHRRILNIVFPRTLRHHVLLHAIFGHEIGHAAWAVPARRSRLRTDVLDRLFQGTPMESSATAETWLSDPRRPKDTTQYLSDWSAAYPHPFTFGGKNNATHLNWQQEFFCDLFGVLTFGASFACALKALLGGFNPSGHTFSDSHPPWACRAVLVARAMERLGWFDKKYETGKAEVDEAMKDLKEYVRAVPSSDPWYDLFPAKQVDNAIAGARAALAGSTRLFFDPPDINLLRETVEQVGDRVPPTALRLVKEDCPTLNPMEFRTLLAAGWIVALGQQRLALSKELTFEQINRLCDRGILHQQAIDLKLRKG